MMEVKERDRCLELCRALLAHVDDTDRLGVHLGAGYSWDDVSCDTPEELANLLIKHMPRRLGHASPEPPSASRPGSSAGARSGRRPSSPAPPISPGSVSSRALACPSPVAVGARRRSGSPTGAS